MDVVMVILNLTSAEEAEEVYWWTELALTLIILQEKEMAMEAAGMEEEIQVIQLVYRELFC